MKLNNTLILAGLVAGSVLTATVAVRAQDNTSASTTTTPTNAPAHPRPRGPMIDIIANQLGLNEDQKAKVKPILEDRNQQIRELTKDKSLDQAARRDKVKQIRDNTNAKLKDVLTEEQYAKWEKIGTPRRRPAGGAPATPPAAGAPAAPAPATGATSQQ